MGIRNLSKLLKEKAPSGITYRKPEYYASQKIAVDASMAIYQFLIAVRSDGSNLGFENETTSHLIGTFYRTAKLIEQGIVPVYVFDGKAPEKKIHELQKRTERREKAEQMLKAAQAVEDREEAIKHEKRKVKANAGHIEDCKTLLELMGVPTVMAPSEAEAHCAFLCANGCVSGVATEDMDALCFGTPILLRKMNASQAKKQEIEEYSLPKILKELELSMDSFIDMCILLECDYCKTIRGVGPKRAYSLIKKHGSIDEIIKNEGLDVPEDFDYEDARCIFKNLASTGEKGDFRIEYENINVDKVVEFLCKKKGFDEQRVRNTMDRVIASKKKVSQRRLDSFFMRK